MKNFKYQYVVTKTPYRISLGGGGTDLPFYSNSKGGDLISAAIDQYCIVSVAVRKLDKEILIQTTTVERVKKLSQLKHEIIRACLEYFEIQDSIQVSTFSTIPSKTGLGSSSTLTVGLVNALSILKGMKITKRKIAEISWLIERKILSLDGGVQDQYIATFGGIKRIKISKAGNVFLKNIKLKKEAINILQNCLIMIFSGQQRNSSLVVKSVKKSSKKNLSLYDQIKYIGKLTEKFIIKGDINQIGLLMDQHWVIKKKLANSISNTSLDKKYIKLKRFGSKGGKIVGAGGGGFFMMAVLKENLRRYNLMLKKNNFNTLDWNFDFNGTSVIEKK